MKKKKTAHWPAKTPRYLEQAFSPLQKTGYRLHYAPESMESYHKKGEKFIQIGGMATPYFSRTPKRRLRKPETLSVLRHEMGHAEPGVKQDWRRLAKMRPKGSQPDSPEAQRGLQFANEINAWKNAIRAGRGRVNQRVMRHGLFTHASASRHTMDRFIPKLRSLNRYGRMVRHKNRGKKR